MPAWRENELANKPERLRVFSELMGLADAPEAAVRRVIGIYSGMIACIDDGVGRILAALDGLGLRENMIVVFTSDHGDLMGEHAMMEKGGMLYDCLTHVPLILSWQGHLPAGHVETGLVSTVDVMPTLLQLAGLDVPAAMQGSALPPVSTDAPRDAVFAEYGAGGPRVTLADLAANPPKPGVRPVRTFLREREAEGFPTMVRTHRWKYVHDPLGDVDELYDLETGPWELVDLADDRDHVEVVHEMRLGMLDWHMRT